MIFTSHTLDIYIKYKSFLIVRNNKMLADELWIMRQSTRMRYK